MNIPTKEKQTHRHRKQTYGCQGGEGRRGVDWEFGISRCKLLYIEWINNRVLLYSIAKYNQYPVILEMEKNMKKNIYIYVYITESLCSTAEINTTL